MQCLISQLGKTDEACMDAVARLKRQFEEAMKHHDEELESIHDSHLTLVRRTKRKFNFLKEHYEAMDEIVGRQTSEVDAMGQEITDCIVSKYDTKNMCAIQDQKMTDLGQTIHEVLKDFRERLDRIEPELRQAFKMAEKIDHDARHDRAARVHDLQLTRVASRRTRT